MAELGADILLALLGAALALVGQRIFVKSNFFTAVRAESRGALRLSSEIYPDILAAWSSAASLVAGLESGEELSFDLITALPEGWVFSAPEIELLGHGEKVDDQQAYAVGKYLNYWNMLIEYEQRYRGALSEVLNLLAADSPGAKIAIREYAVRVRDNLRELADACAQVHAQAARFYQGAYVALEKEQEQLYIEQARESGTLPPS